MKRFSWQVWVLGTILVLSLGTACKKRAATDTSLGKVMPVADDKDDNGWPVYEVSSEGFALALPPDWRQFDMNPKTFEAKIQETLKQNPQLGPMVGNLRQQLTAGVKFFGFDMATAGTGFATNVNVMRAPLPPGTTLDTAVADTVRQLESLATVTKPVAHERLKMATGDRERIHCKMTMKSPTGQNFALTTTQYITLRGSDGYVVTLTTLLNEDAKYAPTFEKIGRSFRFIKQP